MCRKIKAQNGLQIQPVSLDLILKYEPIEILLKTHLFNLWSAKHMYLF